MARIRDGNRSVLLIVDLQNGVMAEAWEAGRVLARAALAVRRARELSIPVIWVQHEDENLVHGSEAWQWSSGLGPANGETLIAKRFNSAFEATELDAHLARVDATRIVLAGAASNWCIRATAYAALDRGYDLTLIEDAHTTEDMTLEDGVRIDARSVVRELNVAIRWLSYPGLSNGVARADEVGFGGP